MKYILILLLFCSGVTFASTDAEVTKISNKLCYTNDSCKDIVAINLNGSYYEGLNEKQDVSIGTLINRKSKSLMNLCDGLDISVCKEYKDQLMLRYMKGLLSR